MHTTSDHIAFERTGSGPPMILVHGCPATHTLWRPLLPALARHRTLYAIDLPGFGASPAPADPTELAPARLARAILAFARRQGLERFDLVGHSFGGAIAAEAATEAPERVASLVMVAPMGTIAPPAARLARSWAVRSLVAPAWRLVPRPLRRTIVRIGSRANYGPAYVPERGREIARELDRPDALRAICRLVGAFDYDEYRARLERLQRERTVPTLLIGACRDRVVPFEHFVALRRIVARAEHEELADGVHVVMWQHPEPIAERIIGFIEHAAMPDERAVAR
ncbi:MAG TPA: alpha/beta fold hydrolase [Candidatus Kapabacteria bacterium]|nr:alpha/beta fold hydrolase [Candidatus Kapabacteria bacterium]